MNVYEEDKFTIIDKNNVEHTFYKILIFESTITNKKYIIYTDNKQTNGSYNIYGSILLSNADNIMLEELIDDVDKEEVNKAILKVKMEME